jgi:hypothetical protein
MLSSLRFILLLPLALLLACGSTTPISTTTPTPSGDYVFLIEPAGGTSLSFSGNLSVSGTSVSGVFRDNNPSANCVPSSQDIPFSGSILNGVLTLTSGPFSNSIATLTIPIPLTPTSSGSKIATGTAVISGGTCAVASSPLQLTYIPPLSNTLSGALTGPANGTLSLTLTESAANSDGQFPIVAAVSFSGSSCSFTLNGIAGLVSGYSLSLGGGLTPPNSEVALSGNTTTTPINISMSVLTSGLNCPSGTYTGTIQ